MKILVTGGLGFRETRDVISACWRLTPRLTKKSLQTPTENTYRFYRERPSQHGDSSEPQVH